MFDFDTIEKYDPITAIPEELIANFKKNDAIILELMGEVDSILKENVNG